MSPLRHPAKAKAPRSLIAVSIRLVQRYARARRRTGAAVQKPFQRRGEVSPEVALCWRASAVLNPAMGPEAVGKNNSEKAVALVWSY
jgi:hypothetical protein